MKKEEAPKVARSGRADLGDGGGDRTRRMTEKCLLFSVRVGRFEAVRTLSSQRPA